MTKKETLKSPNHTLPLWYHFKASEVLSLPAYARQWLLERGSLTKRLRAQCTDFRVQIDFEQRHSPLADECSALPNADLGKPLIRQVYLICDGKPWVFARSIIPEATIQGVAQELGELGTRPLGEILFTYPNMERNAIEVTLLQAGDHWYTKTLVDYQAPVSKLCGRRSVYYLSGQPLLVQEFFTPWLIKLN